MKDNKTRRAVIAGAGPAGLTAAFELASRTDVRPLVFEASDMVGGISRTVNFKGNRIDIGGHRFFSKNERVVEWWTDRMPLAENHEREVSDDRVMLRRRRVSRIFYRRRFFDYPVSLSLALFRNLGLGTTLSAGFSYLRAAMFKRKESSLEDFYINRFGRKLYSLFFEDYTAKVWGRHPSQLGSDWGSQRIKGLSITAILKDVLRKSVKSKRPDAEVETSLIEEFLYPKYGPGQLWEAVASEVKDMGGDVQLDSAVKKVIISDGNVCGVKVATPEGTESEIACDYLLSSMPLNELIPALEGIEVPEEVVRISRELPYRDFITVGLLVDKLKIKNQTKLKTYLDRIPDTWIYVQERDVRLGRIQVFNNWSPYMVRDNDSRIWLGLEYFCFENDEMWNMTDEDFIRMAIRELEHIGIIDSADVEDAVRLRVKKAYPAYYGSYYDLPKVREFLDSIPNLYCIGRNGQHRYNNMDHSMLTAMEAVDAIAEGRPSDPSLWDINTEDSYHEQK